MIEITDVYFLNTDDPDFSPDLVNFEYTHSRLLKMLF